MKEKKSKNKDKIEEDYQKEIKKMPEELTSDIHCLVFTNIDSKVKTARMPSKFTTALFC